MNNRELQATYLDTGAGLLDVTGHWHCGFEYIRRDVNRCLFWHQGNGGSRAGGPTNGSLLFAQVDSRTEHATGVILHTAVIQGF